MKISKLIFLLLIISNCVFGQQIRVIIDVQKIQNVLKNTINETEVLGKNIANLTNVPIIQLPLIDGTNKSFKVFESSIWEDKMTMKDLSIHTYSGVSTENDGITTRFSITPYGLTGVIRTPLTYYIIEVLDTKNNLYEINLLNYTEKVECNSNDLSNSIREEIKNLNINDKLSTSSFSNGTQLRVFRLAAAATGEFTTFLGGQANALAKIVEIVNVLNTIYESELAIRFVLIPATTNYTSIFTKPFQDPFDVDPSFANAENSQVGFNKMNETGLLPYSTYDIGHTFHYANNITGVRGKAGPSPCIDNSKAKGWTEANIFIPSKIGTIATLMAHEIGHQFGAPHSYNAIGGSTGSPTFCTIGWPSNNAVEPGSGSSLMGYNTNCSSPKYTLTEPNTDIYFHTKSLENIFQGVGFNSVNGTTCGYFLPTGNSTPIANSGSDYSIPKGTPFILIGSATDANSQILSYSWDEYDIATENDKGAFGNSINGQGGYPAVNSTESAPLFRSKLQNTPIRTFPDMSLILLDQSNPAVSPNPSDEQGEDLPQVNRIMRFRFTVRDNQINGGGISSDETVITAENSGPFLITSQNSKTLWINDGSKTTNITWSINGTDTSPINCSYVKISFSINGGDSFPIVLAASTPNDGIHTITIPNISTTAGRIKIEAVGNIFFDINNAPIVISASCTPEESTIFPDSSISASVGSDLLNLKLLNKGLAITSKSGTIATTDSPNSGIGVLNSSGGCTTGFGGPNYYDIYPFVVTETKNYNFTETSYAGIYFSLYSGEYNSLSPCTNWIISNAYVSSGHLTSSDFIRRYLDPGKYSLVVTGFNRFLDIYPKNYTMTFNSFESVPALNSLYSYTYIIIKNDNIISFSSEANLTNANTYTSETYTIYGFSYPLGMTLNGYLNTSFGSFRNAINNNIICGKLSFNSKTVVITGATPCPQTLNLVPPNDNIVSGNIIKQANMNNGKITATNSVTGVRTNVTYKAKSIELHNGFKVNNGSIFKAEIGGCSN